MAEGHLRRKDEQHEQQLLGSRHAPVAQGVAVEVNGADQRLKQVIGQGHAPQRRQHIDARENRLAVEHEHQQTDITQARRQIAQHQQPACDAPAVGSVAGGVRHRDQAAGQADADTDRQAIHGELAKQRQVRTGVLHHARTDEPDALQEHAHQQHRKRKVASRLFDEALPAQLDRFEVAALREDAQLFLFLGPAVGQTLFALGSALRSTLLFALAGFLLRGRRFSGGPGAGRRRRIRIGREVRHQAARRHRQGPEQVEAGPQADAALRERFVVLPGQPGGDQDQGPEHRQRQPRLRGAVGQQPEHDRRDAQPGAQQQQHEGEDRHAQAAQRHARLAAQVERHQARAGEPAGDEEEGVPVGNEAQTDGDTDRQQQRPRLGVKGDHQHQRRDGVAEQDVTLPQEEVVRRPENGQGQNASQIDLFEFAPGLFRPHHHHRKAHAEEQREDGPELPLDEIADEPTGPPVCAREPARHALVEGGNGAVEELDVHQEDADQREAAHDVQGFDALGGGNRSHRRGGVWRWRECCRRL